MAGAYPQIPSAFARVQKSLAMSPTACLPTAPCKRAWVCVTNHPRIHLVLTLLLVDTSRVQADLCNLSDKSQRTQVVLYTCIIYSIAVFFVVLRLVGKALSKRLAWDDLAVVVALAIVTIPLGLVVKSKFTLVKPFSDSCLLDTSGLRGFRRTSMESGRQDAFSNLAQT